MSIWSHLLDPSLHGSLASGIVAEADGTVRVIHGASDESIQTVLKANKELRNNGHDGYTKDRTMRRAARITPFVAELWRVKHGVDVLNPAHREKVFELLDSPDYSSIKTVHARLSKRATRSYLRASTTPNPAAGTIIKPGE